MIERQYLEKLKKFGKDAKKKRATDLLLYALALGEELSNEQKARQATYGLRRYRFIRRTKENSFHLTPKGERAVKSIVIDDIELKKSKYWDGKWHMVMYDLPIRFKKARNVFRWKLKDLGFFQFQKSAWIYPYPFEEEILFVADFYGVRKHIQILEINRIFDDRQIKNHFHLV